MPRCEHEITDVFAVDQRLIQSAGGDIQPCFRNIVRGKLFFEAVHRITPFRVYAVVAANPFCGKIAG